MTTLDVAGVLASIDAALEDDDMPDAMRWAPDADDPTPALAAAGYAPATVPEPQYDHEALIEHKILAGIQLREAGGTFDDLTAVNTATTWEELRDAIRTARDRTDERAANRERWRNTPNRRPTGRGVTTTRVILDEVQRFPASAALRAVEQSLEPCRCLVCRFMRPRLASERIRVWSVYWTVSPDEARTLRAYFDAMPPTQPRVVTADQVTVADETAGRMAEVAAAFGMPLEPWQEDTLAAVMSSYSAPAEDVPEPNESPQDRALRLRRERNTGPARRRLDGRRARGH